MAREYRTFLLFTAEKTSKRRDGELFRRYRAALVQSPRQWFRMRDADALVRFSIAAALACNNRNIAWLTEEKVEILAEVAITLYDAVAFRKHRAEAEPCSTFAYAPCEARMKAYLQSKHILWCLDVDRTVADEIQNFRITINFVRPFGGPIHMMMDRYRFVEEGLTIGKPEDDEVRELACQNVKLWYRPLDRKRLAARDHRYELVQSKQKQLLFPGMMEFLERSADVTCGHCAREGFGYEDDSKALCGDSLSADSEQAWNSHFESLTDRVVSAFPQLKGKLTSKR